MPKIKIGDVSLYCECVGKGPTLVFIHGLCGTHSDFQFLVEKLKDRYQVLTYDMRGFGNSDKPTSPYSTKQWAEDLHALLVALNISEVIVAGHSMSARIATYFAFTYPEMTEGLITLDMSLWGSAPQLADLFARVAGNIESAGNMQPALAILPQFAQKEVGEYIKAAVLANDPKAFVQSMRAVEDDYRNAIPKENYQKIKCPVLILMGDQDSAPVSGNLELRTLLPQAAMAMIPFCNHYSFLVQPELVLAVIEEFLRSPGISPRV